MKRALFLLLIAIALICVSCSEEEIIPDKGTIKGKVTNSGTAVNGAYVLLMDSGQMVAAEQPLSNGSITNASGDYTIYLVEPDKYYFVAAIQDVNGDTQYTPGTDKIGYYGNFQGSSWIPTEVSVGSGETLEGINITSLLVLPAY